MPNRMEGLWARTDTVAYYLLIDFEGRAVDRSSTVVGMGIGDVF